jgi:hypothetical protein
MEDFDRMGAHLTLFLPLHKVNMRDPSGQTYSIEDFRIKFSTMLDMDRPTSETIPQQQILSRLVDRTEETPGVPAVMEPRDIPEYLNCNYPFLLPFGCEG